MQDYSISKCTRKCAVSGRPLEPGERFISEIVSSGEEIKRQDIAESAWAGPKDSTVGYWRSQMPESVERKLRPAPNGVLLDTLAELLERPEQEELAYLLALLLVRRRVLSEEESLDSNSIADEAENVWALTCNGDDRRWLIPVIQPEASRIAGLRESLNNLLFTEE